eukprot:2816384-Prymnesium_polylepis.1
MPGASSSRQTDMSDWTAAELSARGPNAQRHAPARTASRCARCTGPGPVKGVSRPSTMPST